MNSVPRVLACCACAIALLSSVLPANGQPPDFVAPLAGELFPRPSLHQLPVRDPLRQQMAARAWSSPGSFQVRQPEPPRDFPAPAAMPMAQLVHPPLLARHEVAAEFERQEALLLGCGELVHTFPQILTDIVAAAHQHVPVVALVADAEDRQSVLDALRQRDLPTSAVQFLEVAHQTMWVRDYGPLFVLCDDGVRAIVDAEYGQFDRPQDDQVPLAIAGRMHLPIMQPPLCLEGGNLLSNGEGLLLTTTALIDRNLARGYDEPTIRQLLAEFCGASEVIFLEPLQGEATGHIDMFACFTAPQTVVIGQYEPGVDDENAAVLDRNAARLARVHTSTGPLNVIRVPMPPNQDGLWRTYTNGIFANGVLLVPVYPSVDSKGRESALAMYQHLMPRWKIVPINAEGLISSGGALHCISSHIPARRG